MSGIDRRHISDLRGATGLAVDATIGITDLVERLHHTIQLAHPPVGASRAGNTDGLTGLVYRSIRGTTRLVGKGVEMGLAPLSTVLPEAAENARRDAVVSAVNGIYGDHLVKSENPLAIKMSLRYQGQPMDLQKPDSMPGITRKAAFSGKVMLFIHGLCLNEDHWSREGGNQSEMLATDLGYTPIYLRYNSGLPIMENGQMLARMLETLVHNWPVDVSDLAIVGHSMGGLLARSACREGGISGHDWLQHLRSLVCVGTPHHGAPLERGGNWLDAAMDLSPYFTPFTRIAKSRSAGINDLQHGSITDCEKDVVTLPAGVNCYAIAATLGKERSLLAERLVGDGLVPIDSALGISKNAAYTLAFPASQQWIGFETGHLDLLHSSGVYRQLREWLQPGNM